MVRLLKVKYFAGLPEDQAAVRVDEG